MSDGVGTFPLILLKLSKIAEVLLHHSGSLSFRGSDLFQMINRCRDLDIVSNCLRR